MIISFFSFSGDFLSHIKAFYVKTQGLVGSRYTCLVHNQSHERRPTGTHHALPIGCCQAAYLTWLDTRKPQQDSSHLCTILIILSEIVYVFSDKYTDYPLLGGNVRACACNVYQAAFPQEMQPGIEASLKYVTVPSKNGRLIYLYVLCCACPSKLVICPTNNVAWSDKWPSNFYNVPYTKFFLLVFARIASIPYL